MLAVVVVEGFAILLLGLLVAGLLRSHAEILRALHQLGASLDPAPDRAESGGPVPITLQRPSAASATAYDITGTSLDAETTGLAIVGAPQSTLLAFLTSGCATCGNFWSAFGNRDVAVPGKARLVIVVKDAGEESPARLRELAPPGITLVLSSAAWAEYQVPASPYFVYVDGPAGRVIGEGAAATWPQVAGLLRQAVSDTPVPPHPVTILDLDNPDSIDRELQQAGIGPGHTSLYASGPTEPGRAAESAGPAGPAA